MSDLLKPGENPELDEALRTKDWHEIASVLYDIQELITVEQATYYFERYLAENEIINSPLYKAMREKWKSVTKLYFYQNSMKSGEI